MERKGIAGRDGDAVREGDAEREDRLGRWQKKRAPRWEMLLKKIGGDLLFHKQVQYHRR